MMYRQVDSTCRFLYPGVLKLAVYIYPQGVYNQKPEHENDQEDDWNERRLLLRCED